MENLLLKNVLRVTPYKDNEGNQIDNLRESIISYKINPEDETIDLRIEKGKLTFRGMSRVLAAIARRSYEVMDKQTSDSVVILDISENLKEVVVFSNRYCTSKFGDLYLKDKILPLFILTGSNEILMDPDTIYLKDIPYMLEWLERHNPRKEEEVKISCVTTDLTTSNFGKKIIDFDKWFPKNLDRYLDRFISGEEEDE